MSKVINEFRQIAKKANVELNTSYDCRKAEPFYLDLLKLIKSNLNDRDIFVNELLLILTTGYAPWEILTFCMRELQWEEIQSAVLEMRNNEMHGKNDFRYISVYDDILQVYDDVWEDADLYKYYSS